MEVQQGVEGVEVGVLVEAVEPGAESGLGKETGLGSEALAWRWKETELSLGLEGVVEGEGEVVVVESQVKRG